MPTSGTERRTCSLPLENADACAVSMARRATARNGFALDQAPSGAHDHRPDGDQVRPFCDHRIGDFLRQVARNVGIPETGRYPLGEGVGAEDPVRGVHEEGLHPDQEEAQIDQE
jgi:hypothetical protein